MPLDPQLAVLLEFIASAGHPPMHEGSPEDARKGFRALSVDTVRPEDVVPVASVEDLVAGDVPARLYRTEEPDAPVLVYFHGGGFVIGDLDTHDQTCRRLCRGRGGHRAVRRLPPGPRAPVPGRGGGRAGLGAWAVEHRARRRPSGWPSAATAPAAALATAVRPRAARAGLRPGAGLPDHRPLRRAPVAGGERRGVLPRHGDHGVVLRPLRRGSGGRQRRRPAPRPAARRPGRSGAGARGDGRVRPAARRGRGVRRGAHRGRRARRHRPLRRA